MKKSMAKKVSKIFHLSGITFLSTSLLLVLLFVFMRHYIELADTVEAWLIWKGLTPYKDFAAYHFPLVKYILYGFHTIFGWDLRPEPFFGLATGIGSLFLIYQFGKRFLSTIGTTASLIFFSVFFWFYATNISYFHEMTIGFFLMGALYLLYSIKDKERMSLKDLFFLGLLLSFAELSGQVASITVTTIGIIAIWVVFSKSKSSKETINNNLCLISGFLLPVIIFILYFSKRHALYDFFRWNIAYYFTYANYNKNFPTSQIESIFASYFPLILLGWFFIKKAFLIKSNKFLYWTMFLLSISTIPFNLLSVFHFHHFNYSLPILSLTSGIIFDLPKSDDTLIQRTRFVGVIIFLFILFVSILPWYKNRLIFPPNFSIANDVQEGDYQDKTVNWIRQNTSEETKIMVFGDSMVYVRSDRLPPFRPSKGMPYAWEPFEEIKKEILAQPASYWIMDEQFTNRFTKSYDKQYMFDFVLEELSSCYKLVKEFPLWQVWQRTCK